MGNWIGRRSIVDPHLRHVSCVGTDDISFVRAPFDGALGMPEAAPLAFVTLGTHQSPSERERIDPNSGYETYAVRPTGFYGLIDLDRFSDLAGLMWQHRC